MCFINSYDWEDGVDFHHSKMRTARKVYRCIECEEQIIPGDKYEYVVGKWNGKFDTIKTCAPCAEVRNQFCCSWEYGSVWETILEYMEYDMNLGCLEGLSLEAIDKIDSILEKHTP